MPLQTRCISMNSKVEYLHQEKQLVAMSASESILNDPLFWGSMLATTVLTGAKKMSRIEKKGRYDSFVSSGTPHLFRLISS